MTRPARHLWPLLLTLFALAFACQVRGQDIYYYTASWCGPCQQMHAVTDKLAAEKLIRVVDVDRESALARAGRVTSVPTFVAYQNQREVARISGVRSEVELRNWIGQYQVQPGVPKPIAQAAPDQRPAQWADPRICQVASPTGKPNQVLVGTGNFITIDGQSNFILHCAHGTPDVGGTVTVTSRFGDSFPATVVAIDRDADASILQFNGKATTTFEIAAQEPPIGAVVSFRGFPRGGPLRELRGPVSDYGDPRMAVAQCAPTLGDSGSAICEAGGRVVGVLSGSDGGPLVYARLGPIQRLVASVRQRVAGVVAPRQSNGSAGGNPNQPQPPVAEQTPPPIEKPTPQIPDDAAWDAWEKRQEEKLETVRGQVLEMSELMLRYSRVLDKLAEASELHSKVAVAVVNINQRLEAVEDRPAQPYPAFFIRVADPRGAAYSTDFQKVQLGPEPKYITLPFQPVSKPAQ